MQNDDFYENPEYELFDVLYEDNKEQFISFLQKHKGVFQQKGHEIMLEACELRAYNCALSLLKGETPVAVDINGRAPKRVFPIHYAALCGHPCMTEFLLFYGARPDLRADLLLECNDSRVGPQLPLYLPLIQISRSNSIKEWSTDDSIFQLLASVCRPGFQAFLETAGVLAWNSKDKDIEKEILQFARDGELASIAALLLVARKKLGDSMEAVSKSLFSLESDNTIPKDKKEVISLLFEVYMRARDTLEAYIKQEKLSVTCQQISEEVANLFQEAGFALRRADTDLTRTAWFRRGEHDHMSNVFYTTDCGMPHYGKSGQRWNSYGMPSMPCREFGEESAKQQSIHVEEHEPLLREQRLEQALIKDDEKEFMSRIYEDKGLFQLKGQEILERVCEYRALKCATALLNGGAPIVVNLNGRTSDKMFPIHHAAGTCHPSITELLIYYGARADARADLHCVRLPSNFMRTPSFRQRLPLFLTLQMMSCDVVMRESSNSTPISIITLITAFCLPRFRNHLETVELLAWNTKDEEVGEEFLQCARDGELQNMVALLIVARRKLDDPIKTLLNSLLSHDDAMIHEDKKEAMLMLLNLFVRTGDAIETFVKQERFGENVKETAKIVVRLLKEAGVDGLREDYAYAQLVRDNWFLNQHSWWARWNNFEKGTDIQKPEDIGMPHYGTSGRRWMTFWNSNNSCQKLGKKVADQQKIGYKCFHSQAGMDVEAKSIARGTAPCSGSGFIFQTRSLAKQTCMVMVDVACVQALCSASLSKRQASLVFARRVGVALLIR